MTSHGSDHQYKMFDKSNLISNLVHQTAASVELFDAKLLSWLTR